MFYFPHLMNILEREYKGRKAIIARAARDEMKLLEEYAESLADEYYVRRQFDIALQRANDLYDLTLELVKDEHQIQLDIAMLIHEPIANTPSTP